MVEHGVVPGDAAGVGVLVGRVEGADAPVRPAEAIPRDAGQERAPLGEHAVDLGVVALELVGIGHVDAGGAEDDAVPVRHGDVAVARRPAPVEDGADAGEVDDAHDAARRPHLDADAGERGDLARPRPGGVDDVRGVDPLAVADDDAGHPVVPGYSPLLYDDVAYWRVRADARAVPPRVRGGRGDEPRRVDDAVGDAERAARVVGEPGFGVAEFVAGDDLDRNGAVLARPALRLEVGVVVPGKLDDVAAGVGDARAGRLAEHAVLAGAVPRAVGVGVGVPRAGVEEAVRAPRGPGGERTALDERHVDAPEREVARDARAGRAAADHDDFGHGRGLGRLRLGSTDRSPSGRARGLHDLKGLVSAR